MVCPPRAAVLGSRTRVDAYNRSITKPLTGEPDAGDPPVRFGGRGKVQSLVPTPIRNTFGARNLVGFAGHARHFTTTNKSTKESKLSMKILDIPQSGKRGLNVSMKSPFGQVSRIGGSPANPRTPSQMEVRTTLSRVAARWRALAEVQRTAWMAAAKDAKSNSRLSQSGSLSGFQL